MKKILILFICLFSFNAFAKEDPANIYMIPRDLPESIMTDRVGKEYKLSDFKNKFVVVVFWSRYCAPCLREMSGLNTFSNRVKNDGIKVVLVSPESEWASFEEQERFKVRYGGSNIDSFIDKKNELKRDMGISTTPNTILINTHGQEIGRIRGAAVWDNTEMVEYFYKIKAESNKSPAPVMKIDSVSSSDLAPL